MSQQKQQIAIKIKMLGLGTFTGVKDNNKYIVGIVSFNSLKEIETYIKIIEDIMHNKHNGFLEVDKISSKNLLTNYIP